MQRDAIIARDWVSEGRSAALLRVVDAAGLGPRPAAELLLIDADGATAGSLLGGAAGPALETEARELLVGPPGAAHRTLSLDIADDDAESAGLTCGGHVSVLVQPLADVPAALWDALAADQPVALATALSGAAGSRVFRPREPGTGTFGSNELDEATETVARGLLGRPGHHVDRVELGGAEVVVEAWHPVPQVVSVGASGLADALEQQVGLLGWPARTVSTLDDALTAVDALTATDVIVVIDHDHAVATPVLAAALRQGVGYVGALGSRKTQQARREHLLAAGVDEEALSALHAPTGLDLGARTAAETAVSIVAEVLAVRSGRDPAPLATTNTTRVSG
jgi:xanthine dehydrogenase accessory factor